MPAPRHDALARFVLSPTKKANGRSLDQQWGDLATFLKGPGSLLARWLAIGQMHGVYKAMKRSAAPEDRRDGLLTMRNFVERATAATGVSQPTIYRYVERAEALVDRLGPSMLKQMLTGHEPIANDEDLLLKVAQLPARRALRVVEVYMRGTRGEASASRLVEKYLHEHRLSGLSPSHEPRLRGGSLVDAGSADEAEGSQSDLRNVVLFGDALLHLQQTVPAESVQCVVCSPPFYAQRDFGTRHWLGGDADCNHDRKVAHAPFHPGQVPQTKYRTPAASQAGQTATTHSCSRCGAWYGQLGQEPDVSTYVSHLVDVFREVRRVLRPDGVCWVEIGDSYNAGTTAPSLDSGSTDVGSWQSQMRTGRRRTDAVGLPSKSLLLVPQRLAIALSDDGWIVRAEVVWHKRTALPESVTDRPTRAHTTILMLTRSPSYFYDATAVLEPVTGGAVASGGRRGEKDARPGTGNKMNTSFRAATGALVEQRNCRDVWSFVSGRFPEAHTATFPPALPERCIRASTSEHGACAKCGAPWQRLTHKAKPGGNVRRDGSVGPANQKLPGEKFTATRTRAGRLGKIRDAIPAAETIGWEPTCECRTSEVRPCIVLDPFTGSGTTLMVAKQLGRDYIGIELNEREYGPIIEKRLRDAAVEKEATHASSKGSRVANGQRSGSSR